MGIHRSAISKHEAVAFAIQVVRKAQRIGSDGPIVRLDLGECDLSRAAHHSWGSRGTRGCCTAGRQLK